MDEEIIFGLKIQLNPKFISIKREMGSKSRTIFFSLNLFHSKSRTDSSIFEEGFEKVEKTQLARDLRSNYG